MPLTRSQNFLSRQMGALPIIGKPAETDNESILDSIDDHLNIPLRAYASTTPDNKVNIGAIKVVLGDGRYKTIQHIGTTIPSFTSGYALLPTNCNGNITFSTGGSVAAPFVLATSNYVNVLIYLDAAGNLGALVGTPNSDPAVLTPPAAVKGTRAICYVQAFNSAGALAVITNSLLTQLDGGGGGSGSGDASSDFETLKIEHSDSGYEFLTPNIFAIHGNTRNDPSSTGAYSLVSQEFELDSGEILVSAQMASDEFLSQGIDIPQADLRVYWDQAKVDTAATYQLSRDGGVNWQTMSMSRNGLTNAYLGSLNFTDEATSSSIVSQATSSTALELGSSGRSKISAKFTVSNTVSIKQAVLNLAKTGSPAGYVYLSIVKDNAGLPSTSVSDLLVESSMVSLASIISGDNTISLKNTILTAGTYHLILRGDAIYAASYVTSTTSLSWNANTTSANAGKFDGTSWSADSTNGYRYNLQGRILDLRVKITGASSKALLGFGIFYGYVSAGLITGYKQIQNFKFKSITDNLSQFTVTNFVPDQTLLKVYQVETGQVYVYPAFNLQGQTVIFPANTFSDNTDYDVTLVMSQLDGSSFPSSGGSSSGGGGGGSITWYGPAGSAPIENEEFGNFVDLFEQGASQKLVTFVKVPSSYTAGSQIKMKIGIYSASNSGNIKMLTTSYLLRKNTDAINSTTNSYPSTTAQIANSVAYQYREVVMDLTDVSGKINSLAVSSGDILRIELSRNSAGETSSDTEDTRFIANATEVTFS